MRPSDSVSLGACINSTDLLHMVSAGCFTLFATHFGRLSELGALYPSVRVKHFDVETSGGKLRCTWRLEDGSSDDVHYGLLLAASIGFPEKVSVRFHVPGAQHPFLHLW